MTEKQIIKLFQDLARSQGIYGRILQNLEKMKVADPVDYKQTMRNLKKYKTPVDLILAIEG
jgi:hypothetical protein